MESIRRSFAVLSVTVALMALGIAITSAICWHTATPIHLGPSFASQFTVLEGFFYAGQPGKTLAYEASCAVTPLLLVISFFVARRWVISLSPTAVERLNWSAAVFYLLLALWSAWPLFYCPDPPFWMVPPSWLLLPIDVSPPFWIPERFLFFLLAMGFGWFFVTRRQTRRNANLVLVLLLGLWLWLIPSRFYAPGEINDFTIYTYHLNSLLDAMAQSIDGHHWLIDFPHIYGGYGELLAPLIRVFPRGIGVLITALAVPVIIGSLCLFLTARLLIRRPAIIFVTGLALFATTYGISGRDVYYGYSAARFFFPSVGLFLAALYFLRPSAWKYALTTAVAAIAPVWNMDTGLVLWGSWLLTLLAAGLAARRLSTFCKHAAVQILALATAWIAIFAWLRFTSGQWPDGGLLFYFQKLVVEDGYFCVRMIVPDMWSLLLLVYLAGLALALAGHLRGKAPRPDASMTLMLSLTGIGLFSYFMGRSVPSNLVSVAYPAVLLSGIFCSRMEVLQKRVRLPQLYYILLPCKVALYWWAFLFVAVLPDLISTSGFVVTHWNKQTPLLVDAGFIGQNTHPREDGVFFLSNQSGIFYYLSDTARPLKIPGMTELLRTSDMDALLQDIRSQGLQKLFVDRNFYSIEMYRPEIYQEMRDAVSQNYQPVATSPTGHVVLFVPRTRGRL